MDVAEASWKSDRQADRQMEGADAVKPSQRVGVSDSRGLPSFLGISKCCVGELNANAQLAMKNADGFKYYETIEIALYHQL